MSDQQLLPFLLNRIAEREAWIEKEDSYPKNVESGSYDRYLDYT